MPARTQRLSRLRTVIAERMVESLAISAQLTTVVEIDVTRIEAARAVAQSEFHAREGFRLSCFPFFCVAAVSGLAGHPEISASLDMDARTVTYAGQQDLGIAIDTDRGLVVPVIRDVEGMNVIEMARSISDLAVRARSGGLKPAEMSGGTFTVTNTGSRGALFDTPIINQPQVAILGVGAVVRRPVVVSGAGEGDSIAIRSMAHLALTYDHRLVDGADAARYLSTVRTLLETGELDLGGDREQPTTGYNAGKEGPVGT